MKTSLYTLLLLLGFVAPLRADNMKYLENAHIRVGVDLDKGGAIAYLSVKGGENLINVHDKGRYVQASYYSGPTPFGKPHPDWKNWVWNPIGAGDVYGNMAKVIESSVKENELYVKTIPMQWALNNVPGDCTFETWITLEKSVVKVRNRLNNARTDHADYGARDQELPAVYTIGKLHRLITYDGKEPFTSQPVREIKNSGPPWADWKATEHWAALVDSKDFGVGVLHEGVYSFIGGFHGSPGRGGSKDDATGYIAPVRKEMLDHNIVYTYTFDLIVGNLKEIRDYAHSHRLQTAKPDYRFRANRQHWLRANCSDSGFPFAGYWHIVLDKDDPQLTAPEQWWNAGEVPQLSIRAAFHTHETQAKVFFSVLGREGFAEERTVNFTVIPDGRFRTYTVDLASSPHYKGIITGIRIDPEDKGSSGDYIDLLYISWR